MLDPYPGGVAGRSGAGGPTLGQQTADIVCLSNSQPNHSNLRLVEGSPVVLSGPGEYEINNVVITGLPTGKPQAGAETLKNTLFLVEIDEISVCHLGDLARPLTGTDKELLGSVDVLLVPTGGHCTIDAAGAAETISLIEPKLVVPMHFGASPDGVPLDGLERFLKEMGVGEVQPQARLAVTKTNLSETTQVVVLEVRRG